MRYGILAAMASAWALAGTTCLPLRLSEPSEYGPEKSLGVSIVSPASDREVPLGATVEIEWTAGNLTGSEAIVTILVRHRASRAETILAGGVRVGETSGVRTVTWDTSGFEYGEYSVLARAEADGLLEETSGAGRITINSPPSFEFTAPTEDIELPLEPEQEEEPAEDANAPAVEETGTIFIRWTAFDPEGDATARIGIDPDGDHENDNEIVIAERDLPTTSTDDALEWDGTDLDGDPVDAGIYNFYAIVSDEINEQVIVDGPARITVPTRPDPVETAITAPDETRGTPPDPGASGGRRPGQRGR